MNYEEQVTQARKAVNNATAQLNKLLSRCQHTDTVPREQYSSGGYDYTGSITRWRECTLCHAQLDIDTTSTGRYG